MSVFQGATQGRTLHTELHATLHGSAAEESLQYTLPWYKSIHQGSLHRGSVSGWYDITSSCIILSWSNCQLLADYLKNAACSEKAKKDFEICANRYKETMVFLQPNKNQENVTATENIKTICW